MEIPATQTVLSFGEVLWDLLPGGEVLGGAPFNFAYRAHSLGYRSLMVSGLGEDEYGRRAWDQMLGMGMDTQGIQKIPHVPTGTVQIHLDQHNQPDYFIVPDVAYDHIQLTDDLLHHASEADCICFGTLAQRSACSCQTLHAILNQATSALKLLDINLRKDCYTSESIARSLHHADILKLNEEEAHYLSQLFSLPRAIPDFCKAIIEQQSLALCVVTLGAQGAYAQSAQAESAYAPGYQVDLIDPCGSGDAFTAVFMDRFFRDDPLSRCCRYGNAMGALVASQKGATVPITPQDIQSFLEAEPPPIFHPSLRERACDS